MESNVNIITELGGRKIVIINDIRFKGKTKEEWKVVENLLKEYVGKYYEITETSEKVYIGKDKTIAPDYNEKHHNRAKYGWYRYDTRLALPVYENVGKT